MAQGPKPIKIHEPKAPTDEFGFPVGFIRTGMYGMPGEGSDASKTPPSSTEFITTLSIPKSSQRSRSAPATPFSSNRADRFAAVYRTAMLPVITKLEVPQRTGSKTRGIRTEELLAWRARISPPKQQRPQYEPPKQRASTASFANSKARTASVPSTQKPLSRSLPASARANGPKRSLSAVAVSASKPSAEVVSRSSSSSSLSLSGSVGSATDEPPASTDAELPPDSELTSDGVSNNENETALDEDLEDIANQMHNVLSVEVDVELHTPAAPQPADDDDALLDNLGSDDELQASTNDLGMEALDLDGDDTSSQPAQAPGSADSSDGQEGQADNVDLEELDDGTGATVAPKPEQPKSWREQRDLLLEKAERWQTHATA
eukprot:TRINITY_DN2334_c0_g1_i1.p1 TRINITY_DN2334_c0_g1~~TRINITY_DN2334_c0_g1_i1.p1  ORF type:complete len:376 (+),score=7.99 TRINITY_DN2334_c0_g1_i1:122-1249(+)